MRHARLGFMILSCGLFASQCVYAARGGKSSSSSALNPEALGAKAFLEDLLARRFAQDLQTKVDRQAFTLGTQLDLTEIPPPPPKPVAAPVEEPPLTDLMLGTLDPEELLKKNVGTEDRPQVQGFLKNYRIKAVTVSVGLKEDLPPEVKAEVEKWLSSRLNSEFGKAGKGSVTFIKFPTEKKTPAKPKSLVDLLSEFQSLAGQLVMALAILLGILLWQLLSKPSTAGAGAGAGETQNINLATGKDGSPDSSTPGAKQLEIEEKEKTNATLEIDRLKVQLNDLLPRLTQDFESIIRSWCQMGDTGRLRLAVFAETVGKELGKLPIPIDALADVSKVFAQMSNSTPQEKRDALQKAYWDLLTALNLGTEALVQPFGFLGGVNVGVVNQVLMDQNPKMKTLVSLYLPSHLRSKYIRGLDTKTKRELLAAAAGLSEIRLDELRSLDGALARKIKPSGDNAPTVPLEMTLHKVVAALSPIEEVTLLAGMTGDSIEEYKRTTASLAFLGEWPREKLALLLPSVSPDELTALLRVRPDLKDLLIAACPPLTAEVTLDELSRLDVATDNEKNGALTSLMERLKGMIERQEIHLDEVFTVSQNKVNPNSAQGTPDASKRAA